MSLEKIIYTLESDEIKHQPPLDEAQRQTAETILRGAGVVVYPEYRPQMEIHLKLRDEENILLAMRYLAESGWLKGKVEKDRDHEHDPQVEPSEVIMKVVLGRKWYEAQPRLRDKNSEDRSASFQLFVSHASMENLTKAGILNPPQPDAVVETIEPKGLASHPLT